MGIKGNVVTHTLRKTWGYHAWQKGFSPALIMETLNHSNLGMTKRYLGIRQDEITDPYEKGKTLKGNFKDTIRYRVGDYRIITDIREDKLIILVLTVEHRNSVYK